MTVGEFAAPQQMSPRSPFRVVRGSGASRPGARVGVAAFLVAAATVSFASFFFPWTRTGTTERSGYALARALDTAGLVATPLTRALFDAAFLVPVALGLIGAAILLRRRRLAAVIAAVEGIVVITASAVAFAQLGATIEVGPFLGVVAGSLVLLLASATWRKEAVRVRPV